jgi:predicted ATPase
MRLALERHDAILRSAIQAHGGYVFATGGDSFAAAFSRATDAVAAALSAQAALTHEPWPDEAPISVRMGLHTGEATERDGDYFGPAVNRAARIKAIAHGGQVLCSELTAGLVKDEVPVVDLGQQRLRDLSAAQRIFQVDGGVFPPLRTVDAFPGNLPLQVSSFVGRDKELKAVAAALADSRVVTLSGVGGVGKTRLAQHIAADVLPRFSDGAWLCELAALRDPAGVADTVAALFEVVPRGGQPLVEAVQEFLRGKELLLVLDNCEHLLAATAVLAERLERSCPRLVILATSREGLGIEGERILMVPSLAAPDVGADLEAVADADAVRLFMDRAQAVKADFFLTAENAMAVGRLCRRLDGIPLAIELAAARVPALNPAELARRLDRRFEVLAGGRRGAVERHQTLRAAIDWSYELASEAQRRLLARLAVFAGGCTLEAAEEVCAGDPVDQGVVWELMAGLVSQSLVVAEDHGLDTRYRLLETIRQYGEERLEENGETTVLRDRHAKYYAALAQELGDWWWGPRQIEAGLRLAAEQENILRAMGTAVDTEDVDLAFRLLRSVPALGLQSGFGFWLPSEAALGLPGASEHPDYPLVLASAAMRALTQGETEQGERLCDEALSAERRLGAHPDGLVDSMLGPPRSMVAVNRGLWHDAAVEAERNAELNRSAGRLHFAASSLAAAGHCHAMAGDSDTGIPLATEALVLARQVGMPYIIGLALASLASSLAERDPQRARALLRELQQFSETTSYENIAHFTVAVLVAGQLRDAPLIFELAPRVIRLLYWAESQLQLAGMLNIVAWAVADSEPAEAAGLQGASRRLIRDHIPARTTRDQPAPNASGRAGLISELQRETTRRLADVLGERRLRDLRAQGEALDPDQTVAIALALINKVTASGVRSDGQNRPKPGIIHEHT